MTRPCPGPNFDVRPPRFVAPANACDCHAHVFGPASRYPFVADRSFTPPDLLVEDYLRMLDRIGLQRGVIVHGSAHGTDNRPSADAIAAAPDRLRGVAVVDATFSEQDISQLHRMGFRGARMSTVVRGGPGFGQLEEIAARIRPFGWHLVAHVKDSSELVDLAPRLASTGLSIVVDHVARVTANEGTNAPAYRTLLSMLEKGNWWVKLSALSRTSNQTYPWLDMKPLVDGVVGCRPDRILWGTDWPHPNHYTEMPNDGDLMDAFAEWVPEPAIQTQILVTNPHDLYFSKS